MPQNPGFHDPRGVFTVRLLRAIPPCRSRDAPPPPDGLSSSAHDTRGHRCFTHQTGNPDRAEPTMRMQPSTNGRRPQWSACLLLSLTLAACGGGGSSGGDGGDSMRGPVSNQPEFTPIANNTVGPEGGMVTSDDVVFDVPGGTLDTPTELTIAVADDIGFGDAAATPAFRLEGLPLEWHGSLGVRLTLPEDAPEGIQAVVGLEGSALETQTIDIGKIYVDSQRDGNVLTFSLPVPDTSQSAQSPAHAARRVPAEDEDRVQFRPVVTASEGATLVSSKRRFKIHYTQDDLFDQATLSAELLENVFDRFAQDFGYDLSGRDTEAFPYSVTLAFLERDNLFGRAVLSWYSVDYDTMELNASNVADSDEFHATVAHEAFHLVQSMLDPRGRLARPFESPRDWLDEATAGWIEEFFVSSSDYIPITYFDPDDPNKRNDFRVFHGPESDNKEENVQGYESPRLSRRLVGLSHAAAADSLSVA